jgi:hypothetical protein
MPQQSTGDAAGDSGAGGDLGYFRFELFAKGEEGLLVLWDRLGQSLECGGAREFQHRGQLIDECLTLSIKGGDTHARGILEPGELVDRWQVKFFHRRLLIGEMREEFLMLCDELLKNDLKLGDFALHHLTCAVLPL